jgi:hypothetical protein
MRDDVLDVAAESKGEQAVKAKDYATSFRVDQSPDEVFDPITDVRGWLSEEIDGSTDKLGAESNYNDKDIHRGKKHLRLRNRFSGRFRSERVARPKTRIIFSLGSVEIAPRYPSPI